MRRILLALLLTGSLFADELKRPTTDAVTTGVGCIGVAFGSVPLPLGYDADGASTSTTMSVSSLYSIPHGLGPGSRNQHGSRKLTGWTATANNYISLTLNVLTSSDGATGTGGNACVSYSINSGASWTSVRCSGTAWTSVMDMITLTPAQDLTKLQVGVCAQANGSDPDNFSTDTIRVFDVWTLGTNTPQGAGSGSTAGSPHRGLVIAN